MSVEAVVGVDMDPVTRPTKVREWHFSDLQPELEESRFRAESRLAIRRPDRPSHFVAIGIVGQPSRRRE